ncbi:MAG TPA: hypothetical protein VK075_04150 [Pseudogracilibacillus sp.]|nr:hypothetical protein [Pseudogracilibacillus sp.]
MHLFNVRKGQFVYYQNKLHQVYAVKPFFKESVHLVRLSDFEQVLAKARDIDLYRPKHLDSFVCNRQRYTLHKDKRANIGDYILVINPKPDSFDHHYLHSIESVVALEDTGVITNRQNGIHHSEYWVMEVGLLDGANEIDLEEPSEDVIEDNNGDLISNVVTPKIGDIFQRSNDDTQILQAMVVAVDGNIVHLGNGTKVDAEELLDDTKWMFLNHITDILLEEPEQ